MCPLLSLKQQIESLDKHFLISIIHKTVKQLTSCQESHELVDQLILSLNTGVP